MVEPDFGENRARVGWWAFVLLLAAIAAFILRSFVGIAVLGVFGYYATRPIYRKLAPAFDSDGVAAGLTVTVVLLPVVLVVFYAGFQAFNAAQQFVDGGTSLPLLGEFLGNLSSQQRTTVVNALENPRRLLTAPRRTLQSILQAGMAVIGAVVGALMLLALSVTLSYFLLKNDDALSGGFERLVGGRETTAYAYASAVDGDLESVFFGNFLFVIAMSVVAGVAYGATNAVAPGGLAVPMIPVLAFLTGIASLVPIVVGKVVYLPVVGYLGLQAVRTDGGHLPFVAGVLVVYFLVLDILPQTFLQPYITGRQLDMVLMMFAYLLGPLLFGWYGFFLMPILFVLMLETVRIVLPELVRGEPLTPTVSLGESVGSIPLAPRERPDVDDGEVADADGVAAASESDDEAENHTRTAAEDRGNAESDADATGDGTQDAGR